MIADPNFLNSQFSGPPPRTPSSTTRVERQATACRQVKNTQRTAYPPTNGNPGGKLPSCAWVIARLPSRPAVSLRRSPFTEG